MMRVLSLGGGTQSCALALMSARGDLERVDHVIFADTQGELPETYAYIDWLAGELRVAEIPLHIVTAGNLYDDLMVDTPRLAHNPTPPVHVLNPDGSKGRIGQYRCSYDYKRRMIERKVKQLCGKPGAWKTTDVEQWIGLSCDELGRVKPHPWMRNRWPLIELRMRRDDTIAWFTENGYPTPPRSACWFCPNQGNARWQELRDTHPDLFEKACTLDEKIRHGGGFNARGNVKFAGQMYLHGSLTPLRGADLRTRAEVEADAGQLSMFDDAQLGLACEAGVCFT